MSETNEIISSLFTIKRGFTPNRSLPKKSLLATLSNITKEKIQSMSETASQLSLSMTAAKNAAKTSVSEF